MRETVLCSTIDRDAPKVEVPIKDLVFRPSVYGILTNEDQILLHAFLDGFDFPGGGVEIGESLREGLQREFTEETGLVVNVNQLLYVTEDFFIHPATENPYHTILFYFACSNARGRISTEHFDEYEKKVASAAQWKSIAEVPYLKYINPLSKEQIVEILNMAKAGKGI